MTGQAPGLWFNSKGSKHMMHVRHTSRVRNLTDEQVYYLSGQREGLAYYPPSLEIENNRFLGYLKKRNENLMLESRVLDLIGYRNRKNVNLL